MKSATHRASGREAVKSRFTRSGARTAAGSDLVVKRFLALVAPRDALVTHETGHLVPADVDGRPAGRPSGSLRRP